jgi:hypothetical protein
MDETTPETRICRKCGQPRPLDHFSKGRATCKTCQAAYKRDLRKGILHPQVKPEVRICRECGKPETEVEFRPKANVCVPCFKVYLAEYRKKNRDKLRKQVQYWKDTNREQLRDTNRKLYHTPEGKAMHRARVCKTPRTWLSHLLSIGRAIALKPGPHDPKSGPKRDFDIDLDYVVSLYEAQQGKCAITGVKMTHAFNDMNAMSIDRIDPERGHIKGNIHLICQWTNFAKRHYPLDVFKHSLKQYLQTKWDEIMQSALELPREHRHIHIYLQKFSNRPVFVQPFTDTTGEDYQETIVTQLTDPALEWKEPYEIELEDKKQEISDAMMQKFNEPNANWRELFRESDRMKKELPESAPEEQYDLVHVCYKKNGVEIWRYFRDGVYQDIDFWRFIPWGEDFFPLLDEAMALPLKPVI